MSEVNILLVSGGSLVGQNVIDALAGRRQSVRLVATNLLPDVASLFDCDAVYLTPPTYPDCTAFEARLLDIVETENPDLIVPCRDDDVAFLAGLRERRTDLAHRILCGNAATARATIDKWSSALFCREYGLPFAPSLATPIDEETLMRFATEHGLPLLIKPRQGFAAKGVYLVFEAAHLRRAAGQEGLVVQRYLAGRGDLDAYLEEMRTTGVPIFRSFDDIKHSIQIVIGPDGELLGNFCSRNFRRYGNTIRFERHDGADARSLGERCAKAFGAAGWRGPMNIQCQLTSDDELVIYEFNGRFSGATAARRIMGFDEVGLTVKAFTGAAIQPSTFGDGAQSIRHLLDRPVARQADMDTLAGTGRWQGAE